MSAVECQKTFTIGSANATLPLVQMVTEDIVALSREISDTRERLAYLDNDPTDRSEYSKEVRAIENQTELKSSRLADCIDELLSINASPSNANDGHVDFPALRNGQEVCLCWCLGESEITHWHAADESCSKRRLVDLPLIHSSISRAFPRPTILQS